MNTAIFGLSSVIVHGSMIGSHRWKKTMEKIAEFFGETRFKVKVKSPNSSQWNITVLSIADLVQLAIRNLIGW